MRLCRVAANMRLCHVAANMRLCRVAAIMRLCRVAANMRLCHVAANMRLCRVAANMRLCHVAANMRLCLGARRAFIVRMRVGAVSVSQMSAAHTQRVRQRCTLGPTTDGRHYAVVHVTGYVRNWPPTPGGEE